MLHTGAAQWMDCILQNPPYRLGMEQCIEYSEGQLQRLLHLGAVAHAAETPVAEMLAVIGQQAIVTLAEARSGTSDDLFGRIRRLRVVRQRVLGDRRQIETDTPPRLARIAKNPRERPE